MESKKCINKNLVKVKKRNCIKLLKFSSVMGILMLIALTLSVSAVTVTDQINIVNQTSGFEIILFLVAIGIIVLVLMLYRKYKNGKNTLGYEHPPHEKGKLK